MSFLYIGENFLYIIDHDVLGFRCSWPSTSKICFDYKVLVEEAVFLCRSLQEPSMAVLFPKLSKTLSGGAAIQGSCKHTVSFVL